MNRRCLGNEVIVRKIKKRKYCKLTIKHVVSFMNEKPFLTKAFLYRFVFKLYKKLIHVEIHNLNLPLYFTSSSMGSVRYTKIFTFSGKAMTQCYIAKWRLFIVITLIAKYYLVFNWLKKGGVQCSTVCVTLGLPIIPSILDRLWKFFLYFCNNLR